MVGTIGTRYFNNPRTNRFIYTNVQTNLYDKQNTAKLPMNSHRGKDDQTEKRKENKENILYEGVSWANFFLILNDY